VKALVTFFALAASDITIRGWNGPLLTIMARATPKSAMKLPMG
jgi:hypothetical protein